MKYLMPLMNSSNVLKQNQNSANNTNNINLKFYLGNKKNYINKIDSILSSKKNNYGKMISGGNNSDNINNSYSNKNFLPNISNNNYGK